MGRKIIHLDLDAFFCAVEEKKQPGLTGTEFAVGGRPESRGVISSCSYAARMKGVRSAMPVTQALRVCPGLLILSPHFPDYRHYSELVFTEVGRWSPYVEQVSIDEAFIDVSDLHEEGGFIASQLQTAIYQKTGLPCSLGVATSKLVAKIATDFGKASCKFRSYPMSIHVVPEGSEASFLAPLPVRMMWGVGSKTADRLAEIGIKTIGQIAVRSGRELANIFGKFGNLMVEYANGIDNSQVTMQREMKSISQERTFPKDISDVAILEKTVLSLAEMVAIRLRRKNLSASIIRIKIRWPNYSTKVHQVTLHEPTFQESEIQKRAFQLFHQVWTPGKLVRLLGLGVSGFSPPRLQLNLWGGNDEKELKLNAAMDFLEEKYGKRVIRRGQME